MNPSTVSRILVHPDDTRHASDQLRRAVLRAAWELGYLRPAIWRTLIGIRTTVGFLTLTDPGWRYSPTFTWPAYLALALNRRGFDLQWCSPLSVGDWSVRRPTGSLAGLIVHDACWDAWDELRPLMKDIPTVLLNWIEDSAAADLVRPDDVLTGRLAGEHLVGLGHRRVLFVGILPQDDSASHGARMPHPSMDLRLTGLRDVVTAVGGQVDQLPADLAQIIAAVRSDHGPTAVVIYTGWTAVAVQQALLAAGVRIPQDVSVITLDDAVFTESMTPSLTGIRQPRGAMADEVVDLLVQRINGCQEPWQQRILSGELMIHGSTGPACR